MKKRIISIFFAIVMVISTMPISVLGGEETAGSVQASIVADGYEGKNNLGFDPTEFAKKQGKSVVKDQIKNIPYVGGFAADALDSTLNRIFGIEESSGPSVGELIQNILIQLEAIQLQLDTLTKKFEQESYIRQNFVEFNSSITDVVVLMDSQLYSRLQKYAVDNTESMTEDEARLDEMRRTLGIALLFSSLPQAGEGAESIAEESNGPITSLTDLIQTVDRLSKRFCGNDIALIKDNKSLLENAYYISCFDSLLGGEAAMKAGSYNQQVSSILSDAYTVLFTIMEARLSVAKNLSDYTSLDVDSSTELGILVSLLNDKLNEFNVGNISDDLDSLHISYAKCFYGQDERAKAKNPETFNDNYKSVAESYNDFVQLHWFDYIRDIKIISEIAQADFVPLNRTLNMIYSSDKDAFGVNWSTTGTSVKGMLNDAVAYTNQKIKPVIEINEAENLLNHIIDNTNNLFLPEKTEENDTGIKTFTLFKLLETFGFEVPDAKGLTPYMIHNTESDFNEYYEKDHKIPEFKYKAHLYVNGLNCSDSIVYSYNQKGELITEKEGLTKNRYYYYRRDNSNNKDLWSTYTDQIYCYFAPAPLELDTEQDFVDFIQSIANGNNYWGYTVNLNTDVNINVPYSTLWPTDKYDNEFRGTFNGNNHTISGLKDTTVNLGGGLFRTLGDDAEVKNLIIQDAVINGTGTNKNYGVLAGQIKGKGAVTISNVTVKGGSVTGDDRVGGLVGACYSNKQLKMTDCHNSATVNSTHGTGGGILAWCESAPVDFTNSSNSSNVTADSDAGGIAGWLGDEDTDQKHIGTKCSNTGNITSSRGDVGGIVGHLFTDNLDHQFSECSNTGNITNNGDKAAGGIIGSSKGGGDLSSCNNTGAVKSVSGSAGGILGWNEDDAIKLYDSVNKGNINGKSHSGGIAGFLGSKDGDPKYTVHDCENYGSVTTDGDVGGIVGRLESDNLNHDFFKCYNQGNITTNGDRSAGGIIGSSFGGGDLSSCTNTGDVKSVSATAGGILGWNEDDYIDFSKSINQGTITADKGHAGGIAGFLGAEPSHTVYKGTSCSNSGSVTAKKDAGGIIGHLETDNTNQVFSSCSNSGTICSTDQATGAIIGSSFGGGTIAGCTNSGTLKARSTSCKYYPYIGWNKDDPWTTKAAAAAIKDEMRKQKAAPESYKIEDKSALLDAYEIVAQNPEVKAELEEDDDLQAWIQKMKEDVKAEKQHVTSNGCCISLNAVNGGEPDWKYVLSATAIETPADVKAKLGKDWKVLDARDITVLLNEKPAEGKFTFGFSGKDFAKYKKSEAIVYHVTEKGIEKLKPVWNEEKQCFEVTSETCSPFVFAVNTKDAPNTGDPNNMLLWALLLALSIIGLGIGGYFKSLYREE